MSSIVHLRALCREGRLKEALHILVATHNPPLDSSTYLQLLQTCIAEKAHSEGKLLHSFIADRGFVLSTRKCIQNKLLHLYSKCGSLADARKVFNHMTEPDVFSWNMIISAHRRHGFHREALMLFYQMQQTGVQPDQFTFASILPACAKMGDFEQGTDIHQSIIQGGFLSDVVVGNALIDMYAKFGRIQKAREVFDKMPQLDVVSWTSMLAGYAQNGLLDEALRIFNQIPQRDVVSWNAMIAGYAQNGYVEKALEIFKQMQQTAVQPDDFTFASILPVCAKMGAVEQGMDIHQSIIESRFSSNIVVGNALIDMYAKCGNMQKAHQLFNKVPQPDVITWNVMITGYAQNGVLDEALSLFKEMPQQDVVSWNAIITGYAQNGFFENSLEFFKKMQQTGVQPDQATFASILPACAKTGALEHGMSFHQKIIEGGFLSSVVVASALIDMYAKCGSIQKARELFNKMHHRNVVSWNSTIAGYAMNGYGKDALKLFELMKHSGTYPDHVSFVCILFACSHAGLVNEGCKYFSAMSDSYCIVPRMGHYVCMIDLLGRAGYLEEALIFIIKMAIKPEVPVWICLLGSCRSHKNIRLGEFTATLLFELEPKHDAPYVLLSDIYAEVGRWGDVQKVRRLMKDRGIKKIPGCSWIEVNNMVHSFFVGDKSHPQTQEIYTKLEDLSWKMKAAGYISDSKYALNDVEEEEKELFLGHHSEKLAIAFGLLNTSPGTSIRIVKNLRVCVDCHTATKFISKIVAREIVVRDANRFHHFRHGQCSCGDYW